MALFDDVKEVIAEVLYVSPDDIVETAILDVELGADELDTVEIMIDLEERFDIQIDDGAMMDAGTVREVVTLVRDALEDA